MGSDGHFAFVNDLEVVHYDRVQQKLRVRSDVIHMDRELEPGTMSKPFDFKDTCYFRLFWKGKPRIYVVDLRTFSAKEAMMFFENPFGGHEEEEQDNVLMGDENYLLDTSSKGKHKSL